VTWNFKGGVMGEAAGTHRTHTSGERFPNGPSQRIANAWGEDAQGAGLADALALRQVLARRRLERKMRRRVVSGYVATWEVVKYAVADILDDTGRRPPVYSGLAGVYRLLAGMSMRATDSSRLPRAPLDDMRAYIRECMLASALASNVDPTAADAQMSVALRALSSTDFSAFMSMLSSFDRAMYSTRGAAARVSTRTLGSRVMSDPEDAATLVEESIASRRVTLAGFRAYAYQGTLIVSLGNEVVVLSVSDMGRAHQFLAGTASGMIAVAAQCAFAPGLERVRTTEAVTAYCAQVRTLLQWGAKCPPGNEVLVCKAAKRAYGAYLGELAGPECRSETVELWREADETAPGIVSPSQLRAYIDVARGWTAGMSLNIAKVYKLCPAPDACPGMTMIDRYATVINPNPVDRVMLEQLVIEHRAQMLRAYIRSPGVALSLRDDTKTPSWWDAYTAGQYDSVPSMEIHEFLQWEGTATMPPRSPLNPSVWKDSGLGFDSVEIANDPERERRHGNMLLRMVFDARCPMPGVRHMKSAHDHKEDTKPEGHKDPSRGIYSGNLPDRLDQSWMEVAVERIAHFHPSFSIGADTTQREVRTRATLARPSGHNLVAMYYSFDVKGWSPQMPAEPQHMSHDFFAELYDEELFRRARNINERARVYMNKAGYQCHYVNPVANFEGYNGKEMTTILISLLSLSVRRWRVRIVEKKLATQTEARGYAAILLAYIDDGLSRVDLPKERASVLFSEFKLTVIETFRGCGYVVEISKCYPSDRFFVFLNEIYLAGRHVVHGTRAAMTICAENVEPHTTLVERVSAASAGCRGAVMAGLDAAAGAMLQAYHTWTHITEWTRKPDPVVAAVWTFMPRAWGGLGMPTMLQLGTSGGGAALAESATTLHRYAMQNATARRVYVSCARSAMVSRTAASLMASPLGGSLGRGVLTESRVPSAVREALTRLRDRRELSPTAQEFLSYADFASFSEYASALIPVGTPEVIQAQVISDAAAIHPHAIFSAFARRLEKSSTLAQLVTPKRMREIIRANRVDAKESYEHVVTRAITD
jgi:hypothetical protein